MQLFDLHYQPSPEQKENPATENAGEHHTKIANMEKHSNEQKHVSIQQAQMQ